MIETFFLGNPMNVIPTKDPRFSLRFAKPEDARFVVSFMKKLGAYQKMEDKIIATDDGIRKLLADKRGEAVFGIYDGEMVGFAYFCQTSSAFTGQTGLYLDGFLIDAAMRFKGLGKIMMSFMSKLALERGCQRLEWGCLDWNEPTIKFYKELGANSMDSMTIYRLAPDQLRANAAMF